MTAFEERELRVIEEFLIKRILKIRSSKLTLRFTNESKPKKVFNCIVANMELLEKIQSRIPERFTSNELQIITSCVNENLPILHNKSVDLDQRDKYSLSKEQRESKQIQEICMGILEKTGYFNKYLWVGIDLPFSLGKMTHLLERAQHSFKRFQK